MDRYVGLDAHAETCTLGVVSASGRRLTAKVVETNGRTLIEAVQSIPGRVHLCLEEGTQSAWLYEILEPHVEEIVVTTPPENKGPKDDLRDAWARAEELRIGAIHTRVYKAPQQFAGLRSAASTYRVATRDVVRVKNRLKAVLRSRGIRTDSGVYDQEKRVQWLQQLPAFGHRQAAEWLGRELDELEPLREDAKAWLLKEAKAYPIIRKLETAPGMGPLGTAQLVGIVGTPHRFRTRRQFWSYSGLGIVTRSSSDWVRDGGRWVRATVRQTRGLNRKRQPVLKSIFTGAATTVITQLRDDPLHADYERMLQSGIKPNLAKLTLARRIAAIVLAMWKSQEVYDPNRHKPVTDRT